MTRWARNPAAPRTRASPGADPHSRSRGGAGLKALADDHSPPRRPLRWWHSRLGTPPARNRQWVRPRARGPQRRTPGSGWSSRRPSLIAAVALVALVLGAAATVLYV